MAYTQTTSEITLDLVAAACIAGALDRRVEALERRLNKVTRESRRQAIRNELDNLRRAMEAFEPVYTACLAAPLFTIEYEALIDGAKGEAA